MSGEQRPDPCRDPNHAHGTWGVGEIADRICAKHRACVEFDKRQREAKR